jgi:kumamolisin
VQDIENDPGVLSVSWGYTEDEDVWTQGAMITVNEALQEAALAGMTVCVASGDDGSSDAILDGSVHVGFPGSSPYVCCVGGTTAKKGSPLPDVTWKEGDGLRSDQQGSTGGGVSAVFERPEWQASVTIASRNPGAILGRCLPDLSANADWDAAPYALVVDGQLQPNGGTSAATPLIASLVTLFNEQRAADNRVGYLTPVLYQPAAGGTEPAGALGCSDVVQGNNVTAAVGGYSAAPGYDAVTGWGTPIGVKLQLLF